jgi:hypothetical protein
MILFSVSALINKKGGLILHLSHVKLGKEAQKV